MSFKPLWVKITFQEAFVKKIQIWSEWKERCNYSLSNEGSYFFSIFRLGAHKRKQSVGTEQLMEIEKIISHQSYRRPYGMAHDIAMIKLAKPARIGKYVNLACMPGSSGSVADGKECWVTG